jgi:hypothetical protein
LSQFNLKNILEMTGNCFTRVIWHCPIQWAAARINKIKTALVRVPPAIEAIMVFSVGAKRFQTIHDCGVEVAHELVLFSELSTKALSSWDSKMRRNNLYRDRGRAVGRSKQTYELTSSIVPRGIAYRFVESFGRL